MKPTVVLVLTALSLITLACGHKEAHSEAKELPRVAVSLVAGAAAEGGTWVAATLQSTRTATLSTRMAAQVKRVHVQEGQRVAAGALMMALGDEDLQAQLKAAETGLATVQAHHRRIQALFEQKAATPSELEGAQAQLAQAQAGVASLKANVAYTQIRAPFSGIVQSRKVNEGDFVGPGTPLVELVGEGEQELVATLSEGEAKALKAGLKVPFESEGIKGEAQVTALAAGGDAFSHKGTLRARVLSPKGLRQGSFARILVPGVKAEGLRISRSALVTRGELTGVFVAKDGHAELRWISLGEGAGDSLPVRAGLKPEDRVIDRPGSLQDGQPIDISGGVNHGK
ncbi:MexH family multidrug efflux RND transporter periplasmic adaptor subunit [Geothrix limicola]|uniref:MexH family multidrug efflux RND transporter periplasmic adaptor subunit n=1 Tax=Geothrix limicola TaxID=2927978 RepID=A0ABQ5QGC9_9BACT|nr:efflux RND transporter periplasmic adaptor subunit [Geothrix limicola]GLH73897.1 MexH family multidrug efflux RND transporter periplasmic adaptor subunit [Geothrix limicola]